MHSDLNWGESNDYTQASKIKECRDSSVPVFPLVLSHRDPLVNRRIGLLSELGQCCPNPSDFSIVGQRGSVFTSHGSPVAFWNTLPPRGSGRQVESMGFHGRLSGCGDTAAKGYQVPRFMREIFYCPHAFSLSGRVRVGKIRVSTGAFIASQVHVCRFTNENPEFHQARRLQDDHRTTGAGDKTSGSLHMTTMSSLTGISLAYG